LQVVSINRQAGFVFHFVSIPRSAEERVLMSESSGEEIKIGGLTIRFLLKGEASGGSVAMFEVGVSAGAKVPIAHSHDAYEEPFTGSRAC
jgi:hypothetical protein